MIDNVQLTESAFEDLARIRSQAQPLIKSVFDHLKRLRMDPLGFSRPSYLPYPPGYQLYQFPIVLGDHTHVFTVLFKIDDANGQRIVIHRIGHLLSHL